ncbi:unnamed protein product [Microthlaspi erraticum]|uniref:F-box domain-containing protein n=1 Tax=Microthlaspi erraticum TaxID=1685480 RepID=A0A6D2LKT0_9BRAS|nr:unnamed protein product [Microthlaspi erraticum]
MDGDGEERVSAKRSSEEGDWISNFPDSLIIQILLNLPTKDVVKCSVLSTRWRNLWKNVPVLDLDIDDFPEQDSFVSFVDRFLGFNSDSCLESFKLKYDHCQIVPLRRWINTVVGQKVQNIDLLDDSFESWDFQMPPSLYTCESLVSLKLSGVTLPSLSPKFVSLPSLRVMDLTIVHFADELALETLVSLCPVLERLAIERSFSDGVEVLRVCSQSLLSFTHVADCNDRLDEDLVVEIDAPRLEYKKLSDDRIASFVIKSPNSLVVACVDTTFNLDLRENFDANDVHKRNMIRDFLVAISCVRNMIIASDTLEVIYEYSRFEQVPLFNNLSFLRVQFTGYRWEMLPIFLASCPNLKSLVVESSGYPEKEGSRVISGPRCLLSSLEYVEIKRPLKGEAMEMKLVSYLLENSKILKKVTLCMDGSGSRKKEESVIFKELLNIPRLSSSCQVLVL